MTIKFTDRRTDTDPAPEDERVAAENDRMAKRREVREQAAQRDIELESALLAEADVRASAERCESFADSHQATCQPWQTELAELERSAIQRIGRREPPDEEEDTRRVELSKLISEATRSLEESIAAERELQAVARQKARRIREGKPPSDTILAALTRPPLVDHKLAIRSFCLEQKIKWAKSTRRRGDTRRSNSRTQPARNPARRNYRQRGRHRDPPRRVAG